jgi:hypothetical protein
MVLLNGQVAIRPITMNGGLWRKKKQRNSCTRVHVPYCKK